MMIDIGQLRNMDVFFSDIVPMRQRWQSGHYSYADKARETPGLCLILSGSIRYVFDGGEVRGKKGDLIYLPQGHYDAHFEDGTVNTCLVNFNMTYREEKVGLSGTPVCLVQATNRMEAVFDRMIAASAGDMRSTLMMAAELLVIFDAASKCASAYSSTTLVMARQLVESTGLSIPEIAKRCEMSESTLRRAYKKHFGKAPAPYRSYSRVEKAKILLKETGMKPKEICFSLGFSDEAYFYRVFRKHEGITPLEYRKRNIELN